MRGLRGLTASELAWELSKLDERYAADTAGLAARYRAARSALEEAVHLTTGGVAAGGGGSQQTGGGSKTAEG